MKTGSLPLRAPSRPVCQLCDFLLPQPVSRRAFLTASTIKTPSLRRQTARTPAALPRIPARRIQTSWRNVDQSDFPEDVVSPQATSDSVAAVKARLEEVETQIRLMIDSNRVEPEQTIYEILEKIEDIAQSSIAIRSRQPPPAKATIRQSSAGAILSGLDTDTSSPKPTKTYTKPLSLTSLPTPTYLSKLTEGLLKHPSVFISPTILAIYVRLQRLLNRPHTIPEILYLYAHKPIPTEGSSPPKLTPQNPKAASQAVPAPVADAALSAAIDAKDISLALSIIDHTYRAPAWRRHRMLTKMGVPGVLAAMTPLAIYMLAQEMSVYSGFIDPWTFKLYAFAGISTYVMCTGTLGFVALTTYNDDHNRVVWRPGVPLLDRYVRADERAALDRVACAWGFKELWKWGSEEGDEWEALRQLCLLRGMVLDKSDLLPGMNPGR